MSIVCPECNKSLTVRESILKTHQCGPVKRKAARKAAPRMIRKAGSYVRSHFSELIAAEMRKTVA